MLLWLKEDNQIKMWNDIISFEDAQKYIGKNGCIWHDGTFPEVEDKEGCKTVYSYENGKITCEYAEVSEPTEPVEPELTETEEVILNTAINTEYLVCLAELGL